MASILAYTWGARDTVWHVAGAFMNQAGYTSVPSFVDAIKAANPAIYDWSAIPQNTVIIIPFSTS